MLTALYNAASGMKAQELLIDNTANNLANVNTTGFKRSRVDFADHMPITLRQPGSAVSNTQVSPTGLQIGTGVRVQGTTKHFTAGPPELTGNPTDVRITGDGFFQVELPNGETRYTRNGAFHVDGPSGNLVNGDGYLLTPQITIPQGTDFSKLTIGVDGTVEVSLGGGAAPQNLGQIQIATFLNPVGLSSEGSNLYAATPASGDPIVGNPGDADYGGLQNRQLEGSNVEVVTELISLISAQRAYEVNSRSIRAADEMLSTATDIVR